MFSIASFQSSYSHLPSAPTHVTCALYIPLDGNDVTSFPSKVKAYFIPSCVNEYLLLELLFITIIPINNIINTILTLTI